MNQPAGLHAEPGGRRRRRRPAEGVLQRSVAVRGVAHARRRVPRRRVHGRVRVRGRHAEGPARPLPPASASSSRSPSPRSRHRSRWRSATRSRGGSTTTNRPSSRRSSSCPKTESDVPETLFGRLNSDGTVTGGIQIPGLASILSDPADGTSTVIQGLDSFPADERPTTRQVNTVHLAWDVMVGLGTLLFLLSAWYWLYVDLPARHAQVEVVPVDRVGCRRRGGARDGSGLGRHRGRPPAVDRLRLHEGRGRGDRATRACGSRSSSSSCSTSRSAATVVWVLRTMSRRFREQAEARRHATSRTARASCHRSPTAKRSRSVSMTQRDAVVGRVAVRRSPRTRCSAAPTSARGSGTSSPAAPSAASGRAR